MDISVAYRETDDHGTFHNFGLNPRFHVIPLHCAKNMAKFHEKGDVFGYYRRTTDNGRTGQKWKILRSTVRELMGFL